MIPVEDIGIHKYPIPFLQIIPLVIQAAFKFPFQNQGKLHFPVVMPAFQLLPVPQKIIKIYLKGKVPGTMFLKLLHSMIY